MSLTHIESIRTELIARFRTNLFEYPERPAFCLLSDSLSIEGELSNRELDKRARAIAVFRLTLNLIHTFS